MSRMEGWMFLPFRTTTHAVLHYLSLLDWPDLLEESYKFFSSQTSSKLLDEDCTTIPFVFSWLRSWRFGSSSFWTRRELSTSVSVRAAVPLTRAIFVTSRSATTGSVVSVIIRRS